MAGQRPHVAREAGPIFRGVGKRVDSSEILDIGGEIEAEERLRPALLGRIGEALGSA